jgi:hypothetical protein
MESVAGLRMSWVTALVAALVPLQPGRMLKIRTANNAAKTGAAENRRMYPPRRIGSDGCMKTKK